jgi:uncharacterized protein (DUF2147 family)
MSVRKLLPVAALALASLAAPAFAETPATGYGVWRNPKNTVHVEIKDCGGTTCGYVVWASEKAKADAREGGTENLVGLQLFRDFVPQKDGGLKGKVFVPDLNHTFSGTAEFVDATTMKARGCLIGNILCKSQIWRRVDRVAGR